MPEPASCEECGENAILFANMRECWSVLYAASACSGKKNKRLPLQMKFSFRMERSTEPGICSKKK